MFLELLKEEANFTNHEREAARYILEHLDQIPEMSASELAHAAFTSKTTIVRLSQKLGLAGFQELKLKLAEENSQNKRISQLLANEPITGQSSYHDIVHTLPALYDKAVTNTLLALDKNRMIRIYNILQKADYINIYGTGISYILAQSAVFKFATLGLEAAAYECINGHYLAARRKRRAIAFLISFTGANRTMIQTAKYLKEATNTYVVGVVGPHKDETQKWCDEIVEIPNRDSMLSLDVVTSFSAANYIFDIFFSMLLSHRYEDHAKSSLDMLSHTHLLLDKGKHTEKHS